MAQTSDSFWSSHGLDVGALFLGIGFVFDLVAVGGGDYRAVLAAALVCTVTANIFLWMGFERARGVLTRTLCVLLMLASIFVIGDFLARAPTVFGLVR